MTENRSKKRKALWALGIVGLVALSGWGVYAYLHRDIQVSIRAGVIKNSGEVYPAARNTLVFSPYSFQQVKSRLKSLNKMGPQPKEPKSDDKSFEPSKKLDEKPQDPDEVYANFASLYPPPRMDEDRFKTDCTYFEFIEETRCYTDYEAYKWADSQWERSRTRAYQQAQNKLKAWNAQAKQLENARLAAYQKAYDKYLKAYHAWIEKSERSMDKMVGEILAKQAIYRTQTDLDGRASLKVPQGDWFLSGGNSTHMSLVFWNEVPTQVSPSNTHIELANDVGDVTNDGLESTDAPSIADLMLEFFSTDTTLPEPLTRLSYLKRKLAQQSLNELTNLDGWGLLHMVAAAAPVPVRAELTHWLLLYGADKNQKTPKGQTPLHLAVEHQNLASTMLLLAYGADPNLADNSANAPLHLAVEKKNKVLVEMLLRHKANPQQVDGKGNTPLALAKKAKLTEIIPLFEPPKPSASATAQSSSKPKASSSAKPTPSNAPKASASATPKASAHAKKD